MIDRMLFFALCRAAGHAAIAGVLLLAFAALGGGLRKLLRQRGGSPLEEWCWDVAIGFGAWGALARLLAAAGAALPVLVLPVALLPGLLRLPGLIRRLRATPPRITGLPAWLVFVLALPLPVALAPAVTSDALAYHLRVPEVTLWRGTWGVDPANSHSFFPGAAEAAYLPALAADASGSAAQLLHFGLFLCALLSLALVTRRLGGSVRAAALAAGLAGAIPALLCSAGAAWADAPLLFCLSAGALALAAELPALALLCAGAAAATKYSGLAFGAPLALAAFWQLRACRPPPLRLAAALSVAAAIPAPWYLANLLSTGNPFHPLFTEWFGGDGRAGGRLLHWSGGNLPWLRYFIQPATPDADLGGPLALLLVIGALIRGLGNPVTRRAALLVAAGFAVLAPFSPASRMLIPPVAGACVLFAVQRSALAAGWRRKLLGAIAAALIARGAFLSAAVVDQAYHPLMAAIGGESPAAYVARTTTAPAVFAAAERLLPENARVLSIGYPTLFRFPRETIAGAVTDPSPVAPYLRGAREPAAIAAEMRRRGVSHLLVNRKMFTEPVAGGDDHGLPELDAEQNRRLLELLSACRPVASERAVALLALPDQAPGDATGG